MPGEDLQSWSTTAASNSNSDTSINWAEGQARDTVNNSARSMMAAHAKDRNLHNGSIVTAGTANAQTFLSGYNYLTIPTGLRVLLKIGPTLTNTAAVTLDMDGLGANTIKDPLAADLVAGALTAGAYAELVYNGTNWILLVGNITALGTALLDGRALFSASNSVLQGGFPVNVAAQVVFDTERIDIGGVFATSAWTPPAGRVLLTASLWLQSTDVSGGGIASVSFLRGTTSIFTALSVIANGVLIGGAPATCLDVADGTSAYSVWLTLDRGGTCHAGSYFSGMLI